MRSSSPGPRGDRRYWPWKPRLRQRYISSSTGRKCAGVRLELVEQIEEALAAAHLLVEGRDQRARRPAAAAAPRRVQHHVVEAGAQRVMRGAELVDRHAAVARRLLELRASAGWCARAGRRGRAGCKVLRRRPSSCSSGAAASISGLRPKLIVSAPSAGSAPRAAGAAAMRRVVGDWRTLLRWWRGGRRVPGG